MPIAPEIMEYLARREKKLLDHVSVQTSSALEHFRKTHPGMQGMEQLHERLLLLERRVAALWDLVSRTHPKEAANPVPKVKRDSQGRIVDELLRDLIYARSDTGLSKTQLARVLNVHVRTLTNWLNRKKAPQHATTRNTLREWIDASKHASGQQIRAWKGESDEA